jgi:hypothetical protein
VRKWLVKFNQKFNGRVSTSYVAVEGRTIYDALDEFDGIGYVNTDVKAVRMMRRDGRFGADGHADCDGDEMPEEDAE